MMVVQCPQPTRVREAIRAYGTARIEHEWTLWMRRGRMKKAYLLFCIIAIMKLCEVADLCAVEDMSICVDGVLWSAGY